MNHAQHVIFGTGPLGQSVIRALMDKGHTSICAVNRSGQRSLDIPAGVAIVAADAYDAAQVATVTEGAAVVYQCAQPPYNEWVEKFPSLQAAIVEGVSRSGAKLIAGENLYMYGEVDGPMHEDLPYNAHTRKGRVRAQMARDLIAAHEQGRVRVVMGRGADFYGPGVRGSLMGERFFAPLMQGKAANAAGNVDLPHTYTFIDDFGAALVILGEHDSALGQAWHVPNPPTVTTRQMAEMAANILGVEPKVNTMGKLMMRVGGLFIPEAREMVEMMYEFEQPFVVDHSKFASAFGDISTPHETALRRTIDWYRQAEPA